MLKEQQIVTGVIEYIDEDGNGVMKVQKDRVLLRQVIAKEQVKVKIKKRIQKGYIGQVLEVTKPNAARSKPICPIYQKCGSCHLMHMNAQAQKEYKTQRVKDLCKAAGLSLRVEPILQMKQPYHYRNKIIVGFQKDKTRKIQAGFYEEFSHHIIPYKTCALHPEICDELIQEIVVLMEKMRIEPYDEDRKRGLLRHVLIRYGEVSKQIMVVFVVAQSVFPARKNIVDALLKKFPQITTVIQNVNTRATSIVLGEQERVLYGKGYIEDELCGLTFRISSKSFYQINHEQTEVLYKTATDLLQLDGTQRVLDAYCGIGTIGMSIAHKAKEIVGVEVNKDAIQDAKINAKLNQIQHIRFVCDDASTYMQKAANQKERFDIVIMDPPRSGSTDAFLKSLAMLKPKQVLYISCNPETQMRDLLVLKKLGYVSECIQPVDMFPQTEAIESIVVLKR